MREELAYLFCFVVVSTPIFSLQIKCLFCYSYSVVFVQSQEKESLGRHVTKRSDKLKLFFTIVNMSQVLLLDVSNPEYSHFIQLMSAKVTRSLYKYIL